MPNSKNAAGLEAEDRAGGGAHGMLAVRRNMSRCSLAR